MSQKYGDLYKLIESDREAGDFFSSLPDTIQAHIESRAHNVNSIESLRDYAENLLRGDV